MSPGAPHQLAGHVAEIRGQRQIAAFVELLALQARPHRSGTLADFPVLIRPGFLSADWEVEQQMVSRRLLSQVDCPARHCGAAE
jgi:hypothetical protein